MPRIRIGDQEICCETGGNLRRVLLNSNAPLYNSIAGAIHCRGLGTCGTCALQIQGPVSPMTAIEKWRLNFPPHSASNNLRLACQCNVLGDLVLTKHPGLWGHKIASTEK
ncbi:MAG: 2Fe-2S iron-sulfur cluster-binding protein [Aureliella sp.]